MKTISELMEALRKYTLQYATENGVVTDSKGFVKCLSPEHDDHDPSMHYWAENNIFYCFGCGKVYDIFGLANLFEQKPLNGPEFLTDNVFHLANRYGLPYENLQKELTAEQIKKYSLFQTMKCFAEYVVKNRNKEYLKTRNIEDKTATTLLIGSVKSCQDCIDYMIKNGCSLNLIKEIGINQFKINDRKLIFIIKDEYGRPVSFAAREMIDTANNPKYINGDATLIFDKSRIFYLWSDIKKKFNAFSSCIIVEGYMDAVTAYQYGFRQIVALGSASFTNEHIKIIEDSNLMQNILVALDNDSTGEKRMSTLLDRLKEQKTLKEYKFAIYKEHGKDLDEILRTSKEKITLNSIFDVKTIFDYEIINLKKQLGENLDKSILFDKFVNIIAKTKSPKDREDQARTLSSYTDYSVETIMEQVRMIIDSAEVDYKKESEIKIGRAFEEIKKNPKASLLVISELKEQLEELNIKFKKEPLSLFDKAVSDFDNFEKSKRNKNLFNIKFDIPWFDDLNIVPGETVTISALPNVGKSTLFQKILKNCLLLNPNACIIYVTPDDPAEKVYANLIASFSTLSREYCKNPYYDKYYGLESGNPKAKELFDVYCSYKNKIREFILNKRLIILDVKNGIGDFRTLEQKLKMIDEDESLRDKFKIMICDPVNKIEMTGASNVFESVKQISEKLKKLCENYKILTFLNYELNKVKNNAKLSQYNISGSNQPVYDANVLGFMYNPSRNLQEYIGTEYETKMYWDLTLPNGNKVRNPILVTLQEKTKSGNDEMIGLPYFYKLNKITSDLIPIEKNSEEFYYYQRIWNQEWNDLYKGQY